MKRRTFFTEGQRCDNRDSRYDQRESVFLQFGDLITLRGGEIKDSWPVFHQAA